MTVVTRECFSVSAPTATTTSLSSGRERILRPQTADSLKPSKHQSRRGLTRVTTKVSHTPAVKVNTLSARVKQHLHNPLKKVTSGGLPSVLNAN